MTSIQPPHTRNDRLRADLLLLLVAVIWGSAFAAQRVAALNMGAHLFNGLRYLLATLVLLPWAAWRIPALRRLTAADWLGMALAGALLFGGASLQQMGLRYTTAGNAGFITGLYVVLIPFLLAAVFHQRPRRQVWLASSLAALGLFLLSTGGSLRLAPGDALELACALMWALHVIWLGRLVRRVDVLWLAVVQNLMCGLLSLAVALAWEGRALAEAGSVWWTVAYTGVFSIGVGYTLQAVAQKVAPAADAAVILSLEAAFAALAGWLLLGELLAPVQLLGCLLMLAGMLLAQVRS